MKLRRVLFWIHLSIGIVAGSVILIMAATGVMLAYEKQIIAFSARNYRMASQPGQPRLPLEQLLSKITKAAGRAPSSVTLRAQAGAPLELSFGRDSTQFVNPYSGEVLGESRSLPLFFSAVENIHRRLGVSEGSSWGKAVTGGCTLGFVGLTLSGPFLWWPKEWTKLSLRKIAWFRGGLNGRALFWNWHNVLGIWCAAPLFMIALTGTIMSYNWANNLLYRLTGNQPPIPNQGPPPRDRTVGRGTDRQPETRGADSRSTKFDGLDMLMAHAQQQVPAWQSMQLRMPGGRGPMAVSVDEGSGGRPDLRRQFTIDPQTGEIRCESFSSYNAGRRLRTWARFAHTGEAGGLAGQTIAALACASAVVLAFTGLLLSVKRLLAAIRS